MDYEGEQQMELEALEAIFMDDLQEYNGTLPPGWDAVGKTYIMTIDPHEEGEEQDGTTEEELQMELLWAHTANYPEEPPCLKLQAVYGLADSEVARCADMLQDQVQQNLGMAMIYTLITAAKEWLRNRAAETAEEDPEIAAKKRAAEEEERRQAARAHGTPVTVEAFMAWKQAFEIEMAALKAKAEAAAKDDEKAKRMSGKTYFMQERLSEINTELGEEDEDYEDYDEDNIKKHENGEDEEDDEDDEDFDDIDYDDDDDEGFLDELEAGTG